MSVAERLEAEVAVIVLSGRGQVCPVHRMPAYVCSVLSTLVFTFRDVHAGKPASFVTANWFLRDHPEGADVTWMMTCVHQLCRDAP